MTRPPRPEDFHIVISNVSKHHAYHMALAAQQIGSLQALITSGYLNADGWLARLLPSLRRFKSFQRLGDRRSHDLDSRRVHSDWFPECLTYAMRHAPLLTRGISDYRWMTAKNDLFDRRVSRNLGKCDIFHSFEGCAHVSFKRAKRLGAVTMLEQPIMHPETVSETLTREYTQMGLEVPEAYRDSRMVHRKRQEYALADYIMVPAQAIADDFVAKGVSPSKLRVIPYGASAERFRREPGKRSKRFRILFVGTLCIRKGVHYLLEAFKRLSLADAELVFVGALDPDIVPILARYDGEFTYIPHLPQSELNDWYNRSSVFVLPSLAEGSAYVIYEAMTCGLPVIVTPHCGSVARDGEDGFVVAARNVEALMDRLLWLYEHPERSEEMGVSGMNHVSQFDWIHYMSRLVETWNEVRELRAANTHRSASP